MKPNQKVLSLFPLILLTILLAGCRSAAQTALSAQSDQPVASSEQISEATQATGTPEDATMKPADSDQPAAGICSSSSESPVSITVVAGSMPDPRCMQVTGDQKLLFKNETGEDIRLQLGRFDVSISAGESQVLDAPCASYLAPGVHYATVSTGSVPAIWLDGE